MSIAVAHPIHTRAPGRTRGGRTPARPSRSGPVARPALAPTPGRTRAVTACSAVAPARPRRDFWVALKVALVAAVAVVGVGASAAEFASWSQPDPAVEYVAGDPAWAHVAGD